MHLTEELEKQITMEMNKPLDELNHGEIIKLYVFAQHLKVNADVVVEVKHPFDVTSNRTAIIALEHNGSET